MNLHFLPILPMFFSRITTGSLILATFTSAVTVPRNTSPSIADSPLQLTATKTSSFLDLKNYTDSQDPHFALFKNSPLSDPSTCSHQHKHSSGKHSKRPSNRTLSAQVHNQGEFCSLLRPDIKYTVLPTSATISAVQPSWTQAMVTFLYTLFTYGSSKYYDKETGSLGQWSFTGFLALCWNAAQFIAWMYEASIANRDHPHAPWLSAGAWNSTVWLSLRNSILGRGATSLLILVQIALSLWFGLARFTVPHFGDIAYQLPSFFHIHNVTSLSSLSSECRSMIMNPLSDIYIDHLYGQNRIMYVVELALSLLGPITMSPYYFGYNLVPTKDEEKHSFSSTIFALLWPIIAIPWTAVLTARGTPLTWNDACRVIVIGQSRKFGYWDILAKEGITVAARLLIIRTIFGFCEWTFSAVMKIAYFDIRVCSQLIFMSRTVPTFLIFSRGHLKSLDRLYVSYLIYPLS